MLFQAVVVILLTILTYVVTTLHGWGGIIPHEKNNKPYEHVTHKVFLDISIEGGESKRLHLGLFGKAMPKITENFRALCTGEKGTDPKTGVKLHYKGTEISQVQRHSWIKGGDLLHNNYEDGVSTYNNGEPFYGDNYNLGHNGMGYLSMHMGNSTHREYNHKYTSIFYIISRPLDHFDNKHAVFGRILYQEEREWARNVTRYIGTEHGYTKWKHGYDYVIVPHIEITDSGELPLDGNEDDIMNPDPHKKDDL